jgi:hypothetical protein
MNKDALDDYPSKQEILKAIFDAVYAQYPKKEWQGLTDDELSKLFAKCGWVEEGDNLHTLGFYRHARMLEQALKEKNT